MGRIITVTDETLNIEVKMFTEGPFHITKLELTALNGHGISSQDLLILAELGLDLPDPRGIVTVETEPPPPPAVPPLPPAPIVSPAPEATFETALAPPARPAEKDLQSKLTYSVGKGGRTYWDRPELAELVRVYRLCGGSPMAMVRYWQLPEVADSIVGRWCAGLREHGHVNDGDHAGPAEPDTLFPSEQSSTPRPAAVPLVKRDRPILPYTVSPQGRTVYQKPSNAELVNIYYRSGQSPARMSDHYGLPREHYQHMSKWVRKLRAEGHLPPLDSTETDQ